MRSNKTLEELKENVEDLLGLLKSGSNKTLEELKEGPETFHIFSLHEFQ